MNAISPLTAPRAIAALAGRQLLHGLGRVASAILAIERERRSRRELAALGSATLADIGLTRADVTRELDRPLWRPVDVAELENQRRRNARSRREPLEPGPLSPAP